MKISEKRKLAAASKQGNVDHLMSRTSKSEGQEERGDFQIV